MKKKIKRRKLRTRRTTILDVAASLRVSPTAVSRALRDLHGVSDALRGRIKKKATELGYFPNLAGAALSTGKTQSIIYLLPFTDFPHLLQMEVLEGLVNEVSTNGFNVTIVSEQYLRGLNVPISESLKAMNADGCVSLLLRTKDPDLRIDDLHFPVVIVNKVIDTGNADFVVADDDRGAYLVTEHLIRNGHKRIVYLRGPFDNFNARRRLKGYKQALLDHGLNFDSELVQETDLSRRSGSTTMFRLLNNSRLDFTAVSGCTDAVALGALEALKISGIRVPQDISVVGFDDESFSALVEPAFTTVSKPRYEMGVAAGKLLLDRIQGRYSGSHRTVTLQTVLVTRGSSSRMENKEPMLVQNTGRTDMQAAHTEITGPSAWAGAHIGREDEWIARLSAEHIEELEQLNQALQKDPDVNPQKLKLPGLQSIIRRTHTDLTRGRGFILIKGFPVDRYTMDETERLYLAIGRLLGTPISQNSYGDLLTHVRDEGKKYKTTTELRGARGYRSNEALLFHTDLGDAVGLLCMQKAVEGGRSSISSSMTVFNEALRRHPEYISVYFNGFPLLNLEEGGDQNEYRLPVYSEHNGIVSCAIRRNTIETAKLNGVHFTKLELDALAFLDDTAARDDIRFDMDLEPGDIQLINNFVTLHSRTHFRDADDPKLKRDLIRLWVQLPDGRSYLRKFDTIYDGIPKTLTRGK